MIEGMERSLSDLLHERLNEAFRRIDFGNRTAIQFQYTLAACKVGPKRRAIGEDSRQA